MRAAVFHRAGAPLTIEQVAMPQTRGGDLVIAVRCCGICGSDLHMADMHGPQTGMAALPAGTVMGHEFAGEIVDVGRGVETFRVGQRVTAMPYISCGRCAACLTGMGYRCAQACYSALGQERGGFAEYMRIGAAETLLLPAGVDDLHGALVEPLAVALHGVFAARLVPGEAVLIMGAGPIGLACAMWCRHFGARHVIVTDRAPERLAVALQMGATAIVDINSEDVVGSCKRYAGRRPELVFECVGLPGMQQLAMDYAPMGGRIVVLGVCMAPDTTSPVKALTKELQINYAYMYRRQEFELAIDLMDREMIDPTPMLAGTVSWDEFPLRFEQLKSDKSLCKMVLVP
jgi:(R,R)-butanediol dehydrogenase / meso-butanediol dehydrogenase / diacetyl reductase